MSYIILHLTLMMNGLGQVQPATPAISLGTLEPLKACIDEQAMLLEPSKEAADVVVRAAVAACRAQFLALQLATRYQARREPIGVTEADRFIVDAQQLFENATLLKLVKLRASRSR